MGWAASPRTLADWVLEHPAASRTALAKYGAREPRRNSQFGFSFERTLTGNPPSWQFDARRQPRVSASTQTYELYQRQARIYMSGFLGVLVSESKNRVSGFLNCSGKTPIPTSQSSSLRRRNMQNCISSESGQHIGKGLLFTSPLQALPFDTTG